MLNTKYITPDDFKSYTGIDLEIELSGGDAKAFIYRVEKRLEAYISANYYRIVDESWPHLSDFQKEHYKLALIEQALYVLKNGDISTDSGYDPERGPVAQRGDLKSRVLAPNARDQLLLTGLIDRHIGAWGLGAWPFGWGW